MTIYGWDMTQWDTAFQWARSIGWNPTEFDIDAPYRDYREVKKLWHERTHFSPTGKIHV